MYKFEINPSVNISTIRMCDTKIGDLMKITNPETPYNGAIVLHTYDGFVDIENPKCTWGVIGTVSIPVQLLPKGTVITLTVE